jgi:ElaB/YqjD/DUF883 family membrane-anchored ribosome-binding protein
MASLDEVWGPAVRRKPENRHIVPPTPPASHIGQPSSHTPTQSEQDAKAAAERVPDASAAAAASNVHALRQLHQALNELRIELDERNRQPVEAAGAAASATHEHRRTLHSTIDTLTVTIGIGFLLLIICITLTATAVCRSHRYP